MSGPDEAVTQCRGESNCSQTLRLLTVGSAPKEKRLVPDSLASKVGMTRVLLGLGSARQTNKAFSPPRQHHISFLSSRIRGSLCRQVGMHRMMNGKSGEPNHKTSGKRRHPTCQRARDTAGKGQAHKHIEQRLLSGPSLTCHRTRVKAFKN